ncbi:MAG: hypothetical protein ACYTFG_08735 [Planctomycetota bacterium]|jgi:hypothetical protein
MRDLFWNLHQDGKIRQASSEAGSSARKADRARDHIVRLEARLEKLLLVTQAMWTLLVEKSKLTEEDLVDKVMDLDLQDGQVDGKITKPIVKCTECGAAISHQFQRCLFCGKPQEGGSAFSTV